ncbi:transglycosylase SLT domain-containing protein [Aliiroseovarius sp. S1339]|uniref:transglycosylase SLT domain-containing protein n=1 Tax=Aliiroseovarius sp. S1339 TaxID=2936990 RepID=UPI0020BEA634|nr:transglycosylase SLT domain-containing protein [Aliiroseovarius sp. S1339]MCK8465403.1 transglycosylase SLT domain-containing protein [Aliiroseovarius sp. S1339]
MPIRNTFANLQGKTYRSMMRQALLNLAVLWTCLFMATATSSASGLPAIGEVCERAAEVAALQSGVPVSVLKAISLTETGRNHSGEQRSWPWTVNMEGAGTWFDTLQDAKTYVYRHFKKGARSFDVGCFQINYKWHHQHFTSLDEMFDPQRNALYAAQFLSELYQEFGDWRSAAGAFHSRTPGLADRYKQRFAANRAQYLAQESAPAKFPRSAATKPPAIIARASADTVSRENRFPLLTQSGGVTLLGSLVPQTPATGFGSLLTMAPRGLW